jgi:hypothetical protein
LLINGLTEDLGLELLLPRLVKCDLPREALPSLYLGSVISKVRHHVLKAAVLLPARFLLRDHVHQEVTRIEVLEVEEFRIEGAKPDLLFSLLLEGHHLIELIVFIKEGECLRLETANNGA